MKTIFNHDELELLQEMIQKELTAMPIEIHHTTPGEFKTYLKNKQANLAELLKKITDAL